MTNRNKIDNLFLGKGHFEDLKQSGFILIIALIFLQVIALLGMYAVESVIETEKMNQLSLQRENIFLAGEDILQQIENNLLKSVPNCLIPIIPQSDLINKSLAWWQTLSPYCTGSLGFFRYYYVIEKLGWDACADIVHFSGIGYKNYAALYFRITLFIIDQKNVSKEWLQSTMVRLDNAILFCNGKHYPVVLGRQMWRELR